MKTKCLFCGVMTVNPCRTFAQLTDFIEAGRPLTRCRDAYRAEIARLAQPAEDAFGFGMDAPRNMTKADAEKAWTCANGHLSDTAKAQIAMEGLAPSAAPSPFEWGLIRENAARGIVGKSIADSARELEEVAKAAEANVRAIVSKTEGVKFDDGKLRFDLIPPDAMAVVAAVLTYGALKYEDRNWELGMDRARLRAARDRHENARLLGQSHDPETNLPHLAHEAACTLMELALFLRNTGTDTASNLPQHVATSVNDYGRKAVEAGRVAASRKAAQHG